MFCTVSVIFVVSSVEFTTSDRSLDHVLMQIIVFKAALHYPTPNDNGSNMTVPLFVLYFVLMFHVITSCGPFTSDHT